MIDQYSQYNLKIAATRPEHVVRKAEFDASVHWLDERIVMMEQTLGSRDGPAILRANPSSVVVTMSDTLSSPQTTPIVEKTASLSDEVLSNNPPVFRSPFPSENVDTVDVFESPPRPVPVEETVNTVDRIETVQNIPARIESAPENSFLTDKLQTSLPGERSMENSHLQGEIEVIVEDKNGTVKSRQVVSNAITDGFLRYAFYDMMNAGGTLNKVLRSDIRTGYNFLSRVAPTNHGIYAMNRDIDIRYDTFVPPYKQATAQLLDPGVVFYNIDGSSVENSQVMIPVDQRCYFDHSRREMVVEYIKNTGSGVVKSVCVGAAHNNSQLYSVLQTETAVPDFWKTSAGGSYLVEHHATEGTSLWKTVSTSVQYRFNLKNRMVEEFSNSSLNTNITNTSTVGGLVVGNHLFRATKNTASGSSYTLRLTCVSNFRTATSSTTKDIVLTTREGMAVRTDTIPVMVYRMETGKLEIFVAISLDQDENGLYGFNTYKVTVSGVDNPATMTTETEDLGFLPYCISNYDTTGQLYLTGYFDGENYYLPYTHVVYDTVFGLTNNASVAAFQYGIVINKDFKTVERVFNLRSVNTSPNLIVRVDTGLVQCQAALATIPYIFLSQVVSGTNLPLPAVKEPDDVLRIIYRYKIG
jgi:hypothetical protein